MSKVFKWAAGTAVVVAAAFGGWSLMKPEPQSSFITEVVKRGDIRQTVSATGEISPSNLVSVGAEASGQIKKLYVKLGQQVKKGDLIAEIDSTNQLNTLNTENPNWKLIRQNWFLPKSRFPVRRKNISANLPYGKNRPLPKKIWNLHKTL